MATEFVLTDHSAAAVDRSKTPFVLADLNVDLTESDGIDYTPASTAPDFTSYLTLPYLFLSSFLSDLNYGFDFFFVSKCSISFCELRFVPIRVSGAVVLTLVVINLFGF